MDYVKDEERQRLIAEASARFRELPDFAQQEIRRGFDRAEEEARWSPGRPGGVSFSLSTRETP